MQIGFNLLYGLTGPTQNRNFHIARKGSVQQMFRNISPRNILVIFVSFLLTSLSSTSFSQEDIRKAFDGIYGRPVATPLLRGRIYRINNAKSKFDGLEFVWFVINQRDARVEIQRIGKKGKVADIYAQASSSSDLIVLSSGFKTQSGSPSGYLVRHGKILSPLVQWTSGGILFQRANGVIGIVHIDAWNKNPIPDLRYAIQAKPLVVEDQQNGIRSPVHERFNRVGIGFTTEGDILVAGAFRKDDRAVSLYDFGLLLSAHIKGGIPKAEIVVNLKGGPGAHIYMPGLDNRHFGFSGVEFVSGSIHIQKKAW